MCGAYGWISDTTVSAANRAAGSVVARDSSLTSSITAAIGVLKTNRRPMSSVTLEIVSCVFRASGPSPSLPASRISATSAGLTAVRRNARTSSRHASCSDENS